MSLPPNVQRALDNFRDQAKDAIWALSACVCQPTAKIKINGRTYNIVKVLGEGGFSFVYLAQDESSGKQFALKKIRAHNSEGVREALREVEAYRRFQHPNVIRIFDSAVVQDREGDGKIVYLFLPLYKRGNLQDVINVNAVNNAHFPEKEMMLLFRGACHGVAAMHDYRAPKDSAVATMRQEDDHDDSSFPQADGDMEGGFSYDSAPPRVTKNQPRPRPDVLYDGDEELERLHPHEDERDDVSREAHFQGSQGELIPMPYAHRDIKPGNIMIADDGEAIVMDLGSATRARVAIQDRREAIAQQDIAAEQSTIAYRAPELFDVKTGVDLDEKVDIWSLGCTLYALAYNHSPFETAQTMDQGGSIAMAVLNAQYKHPPGSAYSQGLRDLIDRMLKVDPKDRPDIHQVIALTERVIRTLS